MKATKTKNTWAAAGSFAIKKVIGAGNIASYALYYLLCLILNREAAKNLEDKTKQLTNILQYITSGQAAH